MTDQRPDWAIRLQAEREQRQWSKRETARRLYQAAGIESGNVDSLARQIRGWENGDHFPRDWATAYAMVFGTPVRELFHDGARLVIEDEEVNRRTLLGLLAGAAVTRFGDDAEPLRTALDQAVGAGASELDADTWERVAFDYSREVGAVPARSLLPELLTDAAELNQLLATAHGTARRRLVHTAAQLAALTAITLTIVGEHRSARRWWRTASRAADESGDYAAAALVRGRHAVFSLYGGTSAASTLAAADEAIHIGRGAPSAGVASGYAAKAQALAELGDHQAAAETLNKLGEVFERLPTAVRSDRASQWGWSAQRLHHVASHVYTYAGDIERAGRAQDQALALYPAGNYQGRAQIELHRAACLMRAGDIEQGARHTVRVLQGLPPGHGDDGLIRRAALTSLALVDPAEQGRQAVRDAYEVLALTTGEQ